MLFASRSAPSGTAADRSSPPPHARACGLDARGVPAPGSRRANGPRRRRAEGDHHGGCCLRGRLRGGDSRGHPRGGTRRRGPAPRAAARRRAERRGHRGFRSRKLAARVHKGAFSLEDAVCAGLLVEQLCGAEEGTEPSGEALAAQALGRLYGSRLDRLRSDSTWARTLAAKARAVDLDACLVVDTAEMVPVLGDGLITPEGATLTCAEGAADIRLRRRARPDATR
ncbi:MAG: hypothetical protein DME16_15165 [Candidatus Rokuibacteriota bacterium]|nr:MAG: hypothetical protein DME16_15165 [Candidatus Rokubacteria bacterium]